MIIAQVTTDNRENARQYSRDEPWFGTAPEALLQGFAMLPELTVHVVSCTQQPVRSPERLAPNIWFHSLHVPKIGWMRTGYQGCIRAVRRHLRKLRPDVVHGQGTERDCAISATFSGYPNVITIHGNMRLIARLNRARPFTFEWLAARLEAFTVPRAGGVVCITRYTQRAVSTGARRTWVLPNAVDQSFFSIAPSPSPERVILCVANIQHRKNQNAFIRALDPLAARERFVVRFLGGANPHDAYVQEFHSMLGSRPWCQYAGTATRAQLKEHLASATALILPSLEDNCPMSVLEAMAARVPVAAARVGGVPELITDEQTGLLFDPLDNDSIQRAAARLMTDEPLRGRLSEDGHRHARERFHPAVIAQGHEAIYRELLSNPV